MPQPSHFCWHFDFYFMSVWYLRMNRCKFRRRSKGLQVGNYYPIILFKLGLQVIRPCSCHRICTTFCVINNFIAIKILIWFSRSLECTHYEAATNMITFIICTNNIKFSVVYQIECDIYFMTYFKIRFLWKTTSRNTFTFSETIYVSWNEQIHYRKHW